MTESAPASRKRCTMIAASDATVAVAASGLAAMVATSGWSTPAAFNAGRSACCSASWSAARSPAMMPTVRPGPRSFACSPHETSVSSSTDWSIPVHQRYGAPAVVQSVTVDHCASIGVWPSWVTHSWLSPSKAPRPSITANAGSDDWVQFLHRARMPASSVGSNTSISGTIWRPPMPPCALMSSTKTWIAFDCIPYSMSRAKPCWPARLFEAHGREHDLDRVLRDARRGSARPVDRRDVTRRGDPGGGAIGSDLRRARRGRDPGHEPADDDHHQRRQPPPRRGGPTPEATPRDPRVGAHGPSPPGRTGVPGHVEGLGARPEVGRHRGGIRADLLRGPGADDAAGLHHHDLGAQREDQRHVVLDQQDRRPGDLVDAASATERTPRPPAARSRRSARRAAAGAARRARWTRGPRRVGCRSTARPTRWRGSARDRTRRSRPSTAARLARSARRAHGRCNVVARTPARLRASSRDEQYLLDGQLREQADSPGTSGRDRAQLDPRGRSRPGPHRRAAPRPACSATCPDTASSSVVLPDPFGPIRPTTSPAATSRLTPSTARTPPNHTATSS